MFRGDRLKRLRELKGLTQAQLVNKIGKNSTGEYKIKQSVLSRYERNEITPKANKLLLLAEFFDVDPDYLLGNIDTYQKKDKPKAKVGKVSFYDKPLIKDAYIENGIVYFDEIKKITLPDIKNCDFLVLSEDDEMNPKIKKNDLVIFKKSESFITGDIVYVIINNKAKIRKAIWVDKPKALFQDLYGEKQEITKDFKIVGKYTGVIRMES